MILATLLALACSISLAGTASADEATIVSKQKISDRLQELTIETSAFAEPTKVHVFLPTGYYSLPPRRWPVTYFLAGTQNNYDSFANFLDGVNMTAHYPSIVVSPDSNSGYWSDWFNGGAFGPPQYETFVIDQLIPLIDRSYRTIPERAQRAVFGISMGGYGAMSLAAKHPDKFVAAATLSGAVDSNNPLIAAALSFSSTFDGGAIDAINGPRATEEVRWRGSNPTDLASNLEGMAVQVRTANGTLNPEIGEGNDPNDSLSCLVENGVFQGSTSFHEALDAAGVEHTWANYGNGCHSVQNFTREVIDTLKSFDEVLGNAPEDPTSFEYRSIRPEFDVWDWNFRADPSRALEFMKVSVKPREVTLRGSGRTTVTTPPLFKGIKLVDVGRKADVGNRHVHYRPTAEGRLTFPVDLGPAHTIQQYRPGASTTFKSVTVTLNPHAVIRIESARQRASGVRVCARTLGGPVPVAKVKAGKKAVRTKLTSSLRCPLLRTRERPSKVVVEGRDTHGHKVRATAPVK
jgi:S-formylglutathione hydrolase FrmB